jgi:hypothetical protein
MKCYSASAVETVIVEQDDERGSVFHVHVVSVSPPVKRGLHDTQKKVVFPSFCIFPVHSTLSEAQKNKKQKSDVVGRI